MEKSMENAMETVVIGGLYRDPSIQIVPTLGPKSVNITSTWLFWSLGLNLSLIFTCRCP